MDFLDDDTRIRAITPRRAATIDFTGTGAVSPVTLTNRAIVTAAVMYVLRHRGRGYSAQPGRSRQSIVLPECS
jgi:hypothetical protein